MRAGNVGKPAQEWCGLRQTNPNSGCIWSTPGTVLINAGETHYLSLIHISLMTARMEFPLWILDRYGYSMP